MIVTLEQYQMLFASVVFMIGAIFGILTKAIAKAWAELGQKYIKG